jgi:hypothetical protein
MTQLAKNVIISLIMSFAFLSGTIGEKCERLEMYDLYLTSTSIEADLVSGIWKTNLTGPESIMFFQEDGLVEIISTFSSGDKISIESWHVQMMDSHSVLTLTSELGVIRSIRIYPTCDGFAIRAKDGASGIMTKNERKSRALIERARIQMEGVWDIISERMPERKSSLKWEFKHDGTFALHVGPDLFHDGFQGIWDITPDGEHVVLYFARAENPQEVYAKELIRIHDVDYEDLVLSGETLAKLTGRQDGLTKVYFEKDFQ